MPNQSRIVLLIKNAAPWQLAATLCVLKALVFLLFLPLVQESLAPYYGISFTDNYDALGWNLARGLGYRFLPDTSLTAMREPGYPIFLAGLFSVFGFSLNAARIANLVFSFTSAILLARLTRKLTGNELAVRLAMIAFLVHPGMVLAEARGGVECLFILILLFFFLCLYRALGSGRLKDYAFAGLLLGLSATVRSTALLFPAFLAFYFLFLERVRPTLLMIGLRLATMMVAAFLVLTPWIIRNYQLVGSFVPTASVAGVSAYSGYHICTHLTFDNTLYQVDADAGPARAVIARSAGLKYKEMGNLYYLYFYDARDEIKLSHVLGGYVRDRYVESPMLLPTCIAKNFFHFWFSGKNWTVTAINVVIQLPYLILGALGVVACFRRRDWKPYAPLLLFIVYTLAVYLPILAQARYSLHLIPFISVFVAIALSRLVTNGQPEFADAR